MFVEQTSRRQCSAAEALAAELADELKRREAAEAEGGKLDAEDEQRVNNVIGDMFSDRLLSLAGQLAD